MDTYRITATMEPDNGESIEIAYGSKDLNMDESEGVVSFKDDFPFYGPLANRLRPAQQNLVEQVFKRRAVVTDGTTYYFYCEGTGCWSQLYSQTASFELLDITKINAPVSYAKALGWAYSLLKRMATPIKKVFPSVCLGTYRLMFMCVYEDDRWVVHYRPHWPVVETGGADPMYNRIYSFVVSPITLPAPSLCPYKVTFEHEDEVINKILLPLRYDQKLDFMWRMGKAIINPNKSPSVIVFYGRDGHEGKTELAKAITRVFADAVEWVSEDLFGAKSVWPDAETVMHLCEKRILVCDECKIDEGFSYNNIKRWTSEAPVSMKGVTGYLSQTGIIVSNHIPFSDKGGINNSIGRRLVIYHMKKKMSSFKALDRSEITNNVALRFISGCISVASAYEHAPTSLAIALYSIYRKNVNKITAGLVYDVGSSRRESIAATCAMAMRCGVPARKLCSAFHASSPSLVDMQEVGLPYIKSIRIPKVKLTKHGEDFVEKRVQANTGRFSIEALLDNSVAISAFDMIKMMGV